MRGYPSRFIEAGLGICQFHIVFIFDENGTFLVDPSFRIFSIASRTYRYRTWWRMLHIPRNWVLSPLADLHRSVRSAWPGGEYK